jgi:hypothetical protein
VSDSPERNMMMAQRLFDFDPTNPSHLAAMPDLGPRGLRDPDPGQQAQNALLGQAWTGNSIPASATQYYGDDDPVAQRARRNMEMRANPGAYDAIIDAGFAPQPAPPALPTYAPTPNPRQLGTDPRLTAWRPSDMIEDVRPTALLLQGGFRR